MKIDAQVIIPQRVTELLYNLMSPLQCCSKRGIELPAVYVYETKAYCHECLQKLADDLQVVKEAEELIK